MNANRRTTDQPAPAWRLTWPDEAPIIELAYIAACLDLMVVQDPEGIALAPRLGATPPTTDQLINVLESGGELIKVVREGAQFERASELLARIRDARAC